MKREVLRIAPPLREPWATGAGTITSQALVVIRLTDEDGVVGIGDAPAGYEPAAEEIANRDLAARREGRRLAEPEIPDVHVNVALAAREPDLARTAGFDCVKLKVGFPDDEERVARVRDALGPEVELRLDANAAWDVDTAVARIGALARHGIAYVEQPCATIEEIAEVRRRVPVPLAADESIASVADVERAARLGACDVVVVKLARAGGFGPAREAVGAARSRGLQPVIASLLDGPWGIAAALQLAAAEGIEAACGLATLSAFEGPASEVLPVLEGRIAVPAGPGLGLELRPEELLH